MVRSVFLHTGLSALFSVAVKLSLLPHCSCLASSAMLTGSDLTAISTPVMIYSMGKTVRAGAWFRPFCRAEYTASSGGLPLKLIFPWRQWHWVFCCGGVEIYCTAWLCCPRRYVRPCTWTGHLGPVRPRQRTGQAQVNYQKFSRVATKFTPAVEDPFSEQAEANACVGSAGHLWLDVVEKL